MSDLDKEFMNKKEKIKFGILMGGFALMGITDGLRGLFVFIGLGLVVWLFWRGRKL